MKIDPFELHPTELELIREKKRKKRKKSLTRQKFCDIVVEEMESEVVAEYSVEQKEILKNHLKNIVKRISDLKC